MVRRLYAYCKFADQSRFSACDLENGVQVSRLIYATILENTEENRQKLQKLADMNKKQGLVIQLRTVANQVKFQTK